MPVRLSRHNRNFDLHCQTCLLRSIVTIQGPAVLAPHGASKSQGNPETRGFSHRGTPRDSDDFLKELEMEIVSQQEYRQKMEEELKLEREALQKQQEERRKKIEMEAIERQKEIELEAKKQEERRLEFEKEREEIRQKEEAALKRLMDELKKADLEREKAMEIARLEKRIMNIMAM